MHYKICTNVPKDSIDKVRMAIWEAGAGKIGNYIYCSFVMPGVWYFLPIEWANPHIGEVGQIESVEEYRLEFVCEKDKISQVIKALRLSHPYEEPPIEIYILQDVSQFE